MPLKTCREEEMNMQITVFEGNKKHQLTFEEGETILTVLQKAGIESITAPCGGKGTCRKCSVNVLVNGSVLTCLACTTPAEDGMVVDLIPEVRLSFAERSDGEICPPEPGQTGYAVACDIGTTAIICQLLELSTGKLLSRISGSNSQRIFGGDVLSRLVSAEEGHSEEIHEQVIAQVNEFLEQLCKKSRISPAEIKKLSVTGNTIMMHFFAGLNPAEISTAPFTPVSLFGETKSSKELGLGFDGEVYLCPAASGFIGSDLLCGILSGGMAASEEDMLLVDLGTNTEMVIGSREGMIACAVDGGAAFKASLLEHGMSASAGAIGSVRVEDGDLVLNVLGNTAPKGICGSGFIDILGILYEEEILDEMGHIAEADETDSPLAKYIGEEDGRTVFYLTEEKNIYISQVDISKFQLAKAAISAGLTILAQEQKTSFEKVSALVLGGGFGTFAHRRNAALLGVIPMECKGKTRKLGNIALAGAISAAFSEEARKELERLQKCIRVIDLPTYPSFNDAYTDGMLFE